MAAYSLDLRKKILSAWQNKENTQRGLAKRFKVSLSFVRDFLRRYRETNEIAARPQGGDRRCKIKGENEELVKAIIKKQNDISYIQQVFFETQHLLRNPLCIKRLGVFPLF
jgi:transposase